MYLVLLERLRPSKCAPHWKQSLASHNARAHRLIANHPRLSDADKGKLMGAVIVLVDRIRILERKLTRVHRAIDREQCLVRKSDHRAQFRV